MLGSSNRYPSGRIRPVKTFRQNKSLLTYAVTYFEGNGSVLVEHVENPAFIFGKFEKVFRIYQRNCERSDCDSR